MTLRLLGIPFDETSSFLRGSAKGPAQIRAALLCDSTNGCDEDGREIVGADGFIDDGDIDLPVGNPPAALDAITAACQQRLTSGDQILAIGGDHAVTFGILRAYAAKYPNLSILHFDAHPDLYDEFEGERLSHACPFARIMEAGLAQRLVQVGIRTVNAHQREQIARFGVEVIAMRDVATTPPPRFEGPVYVSFDLDALDPAFAPGVSHHEPGGLSTREALRILQTFQGDVVGADVVELNPTRDHDGVTAMVAAKLVKELAARMLR